MLRPQWTSRSSGRSTASFRALLSARDRWRDGAVKLPAYGLVLLSGLLPFDAFCPGTQWSTEGAERCGCPRPPAESSILRLRRKFGLLGDAERSTRTAMVRKGS